MCVLLSMKELALYLERQKKERGWTERHFEDVTGISKTGLRAMLKGETKVPKLENLERLAQALDTSLGYLIELCGFSLDDLVSLSEEERHILSRLSPERRLELMRRAQKEADQEDTL